MFPRRSLRGSELLQNQKARHEMRPCRETNVIIAYALHGAFFHWDCCAFAEISDDLQVPYLSALLRVHVLLCKYTLIKPSLISLDPILSLGSSCNVLEDMQVL